MIFFILIALSWAGMGFSFYTGCKGYSDRVSEVYPEVSYRVGEIGDMWPYLLAGPIFPIVITVKFFLENT